MLIKFGAATDSLSYRQETPLMLAAKRFDPMPHYSKGYRCHGRTAAIDTVRTLVQQGDNDPMQRNAFGFSSIITAASNQTDPILSWLLSQDAYDVDLMCKTPSGHTAAAYIAMRDDVPNFLPILKKRGVTVCGPCADHWYIYHLRTDYLCGKFLISPPACSS